VDSADPSVRLRVSPLAYLAGIFAAVLLLTMVGLLIMQLAVLKDSREHIQAQDHKIAQIQHQTDPLIADAKPAVAEAEPLIRRARRLIAPAGESLDSLTAATDQVPRLAMGADLLLSESIPLIRSLKATDAPGAIAALGRLADSLSAGDRLVRMVDATDSTLAELERTQLIPRASDALPRFEGLLVELATIQKRTFRTQVKSLRTQRRQLDATFESLAIQRETLEHTRSIDRKTGPAPPATPTTSVAP
jgi:hypothetical protein